MARFGRKRWGFRVDSGGTSALAVSLGVVRGASPAVALQMLHDVQIGNLLLERVEGHMLRLRCVARPNTEQAEIITALGLAVPDCICADSQSRLHDFHFFRASSHH